MSEVITLKKLKNQKGAEFERQHYYFKMNYNDVLKNFKKEFIELQVKIVNAATVDNNEQLNITEREKKKEQKEMMEKFDNFYKSLEKNENIRKRCETCIDTKCIYKNKTAREVIIETNYTIEVCDCGCAYDASYIDENDKCPFCMNDKEEIKEFFDYL